jgi:CubicO group peptidase (beta-lactamase class C family)
VHVDGDSQYRIASITKVFTVLGLLYQHASPNFSLDDTIDMHIPELAASESGAIRWQDITVRSLASQL